MTSLLKSTQVAGEPIVLRHGKAVTRSHVSTDAAPVQESRVEEDASLDSVSTDSDATENVSEFGVDSAQDVEGDVSFSDPEVVGSEAETGSVDEPVVDESPDARSADTVPAETYKDYEAYRARFESELVALEEKAQTEGFERGRAEGLEQMKEEFAAKIEALSSLVESIRASQDEAIDRIADQSVDVIHEAVMKIIGDTMVGREGVVAAVRQVVRKAKERTKLVVRVSPADWAILRGHESELAEGLNSDSVEVMADDRVQVGGCLLETPAGTLDGRLEVQLEQLREAILSARTLDLQAPEDA